MNEIEVGEVIVDEELLVGEMELDVIKEYPELENLEVTPSSEEQVFKSSKYGFGEVKVKKIESEVLTITPSANEQVFEGMFNEVIVKTDENLKPENILGGKTIFGVKGNVEADPELIASFIGLIDDSKGANCTKLPQGTIKIGNYAFYYRTNLGLTELPDTVEEIGDSAFYYCSNWVLKKLPSSLKKIGNYAFMMDKKVAFTELPSGLIYLGSTCLRGTAITITEVPEGVTVLPNNCFYDCQKIVSLDCKGKITRVVSGAFTGCSGLIKLIFSNITEVPVLDNTDYTFQSTPIINGTGYVYVPDILVESFKAATNWSNIADQIKGLSELEVA